MCADGDGTHLARGVDFGCVPLGLILEVDLVPDEIGFGLMQGDLRLHTTPVSAQYRG